MNTTTLYRGSLAILALATTFCIALYVGSNQPASAQAGSPPPPETSRGFDGPPPPSDGFRGQDGPPPPPPDGFRGQDGPPPRPDGRWDGQRGQRQDDGFRGPQGSDRRAMRDDAGRPDGPPQRGGGMRGGPPLDPVQLFKDIDSNGDGVITHKEFMDFHAKMRPEGRSGRGRHEGAPACGKSDDRQGPPQDGNDMRGPRGGGDGMRGPRGGGDEYGRVAGPEQGRPEPPTAESAAPAPPAPPAVPAEPNDKPVDAPTQ